MKVNCTFYKELISIIQNDKRIGCMYTRNHPNKRYELQRILEMIVYVLRTGIPWRDVRSEINYRSIYFHFRRFVKHQIFEKLFIRLRNHYLKRSKISLISIDTTFIPNKYGRNKKARNKFYKGKYGNKISIITDTKGIPLSIFLNKGSVHDNSFVLKHLDDLRVRSWKTKPNYVLGDRAYEGRRLRHCVCDYGTKLMVRAKKNARTKYEYDRDTYRQRIYVEHGFQKLKSFRRIQLRYEQIYSNYSSFVFLAGSLILSR